jgi:hypothetical protein
VPLLTITSSRISIHIIEILLTIHGHLWGLVYYHRRPRGLESILFPNEILNIILTSIHRETNRITRVSSRNRTATVSFR